MQSAVDEPRTFLDATGWKLIYGTDLGHGSPDSGTDEAAYVVHAIGPALVALQVGNETDLFYRNTIRKAHRGKEAAMSPRITNRSTRNRSTMYRLSTHLLTAMLLTVGPAALAQTALSNVSSDHMLLQRDRPIPVWGMASPGQQVTVQFDQSRAQATAAPDGTWTATLPAHAAGGPYTLHVMGGGNAAVQDVLVGELWLAFRPIEHGDAPGRLQGLAH